MKHIDQYEELYRAWIGEKNQNTYYKKMQKGGFSWPAFWLSDLVMITRKMFVESIILVLFVYLIATVLEILKVPLIVYRAGVVLLLVAIGFSYYYLYRWSIERKIKKYQKKD